LFSPDLLLKTLGHSGTRPTAQMKPVDGLDEDARKNIAAAQEQLFIAETGTCHGKCCHDIAVA